MTDNISIHALLAESDLGAEPYPVGIIISIHALLAESDLPSRRLGAKIWYFYPRSPCGERPSIFASASALQVFLSTLSLRRATPGVATGQSPERISIHALLAESDAVIRFSTFGCLISIHALLAESDIGRTLPAPHIRHFYPRSPCGERPSPSGSGCSRPNFYPRSPCGERRQKSRGNPSPYIFLSTLSLRRAT